MSAVQPGLEIREYYVNQRKKVVGDLWVAAFGDRMMVIAVKPQVAVSAPIVGDDECAGFNGSFDEAAQGLGAAIADDFKADATCVAAIPSIILCCAGLAASHLNCTGNEDLVVNAAAFTAGSSTNPGFVDFDMFGRHTANSILVRSHHAGA